MFLCVWGGDQKERGCPCGVDGERNDPSTPPGRCPAPRPPHPVNPPRSSPHPVAAQLPVHPTPPRSTTRIPPPDSYTKAKALWTEGERTPAVLEGFGSTTARARERARVGARCCPTPSSLSDAHEIVIGSQHARSFVENTVSLSLSLSLVLSTPPLRVAGWRATTNVWGGRGAQRPVHRTRTPTFFLVSLETSGWGERGGVGWTGRCAPRPPHKDTRVLSGHPPHPPPHTHTHTEREKHPPPSWRGYSRAVNGSLRSPAFVTPPGRCPAPLCSPRGHSYTQPTRGAGVG